MLVKYLLATIVAGLFAGILLTPAMYVRSVPLILHAEEYENAGGHEHQPLIRCSNDRGQRTRRGGCA